MSKKLVLDLETGEQKVLEHSEGELAELERVMSEDFLETSEEDKLMDYLLDLDYRLTKQELEVKSK